MLLKNGLIYDHKSERLKKGDLRIEGEKIKEIDSYLSSQEKEKTIDISGKYLLPGIIDSHVHFELESRGTVSDDDFYTGSISAAYGGVTTFIDYADMKKESLITGLEERKDKAKNRSVLDYNFHLVINNDFELDKHLAEIEKLPDEGISSLKLFTTYEDIYMLAEEKMQKIFDIAAKNDLVVTVHSEDNKIISENQEKYKKEDKVDYKYHPDIREAEAEKKAIEKLSKYAKKSDAKLYIVHLSSKKGYKAVLEAKKEGVDIKVETTPHYLLLTRDLLEGNEAAYNFMTPPLRTKEDNKALWQGIIDGNIDVVATDHCAFSKEKKDKGNDVFDTYPGIAGVETLFPLIYTYGVEKGKISMKRLIELLSVNPAKIFGLYPEKGSLKEGSDADLLVYNPDVKRKLKAGSLHSKSNHTAFADLEVIGDSYLTISRGKIIINEDNFEGNKGKGKFIKAKV
ncbi:MAG: dihydropyrimidinase [Candidatus Woesearchaeota archaeon]